MTAQEKCLACSCEYWDICEECWDFDKIEEIELRGIIDARIRAYSKARLLASFGEAVIWMMAFMQVYNGVWKWFGDAHLDGRPKYAYDRYCYLGVDGVGNLVELIDHEGQTFNIKSWLEE